jgi:N utilization substance protein B
MAESEGKAGGGHGADTRSLSSARLAAVQATYQMEMTGAGAETVIGEFLRHRGGAELDAGGATVDTDGGLFAALVRGIAANRESLDATIASLLVEDWPIERIEKVMLAILRAGAYELRERPELPARVAISEYVDIADAFLDAKEVGMVNGVLDRLAHILREDEMGSGPGAKGKARKRPAR